MKKALVDIFDLVPGDNSIKADIQGGDWSKTLWIVRQDDGSFKVRFNFPITLLQNQLVLKLGDREV